MIRIVYGDDRVRARQMIDKQLAAGYEVIEAENLTVNDMPSIFLGVSLFGDKREILLKDLSKNKECFAELPKYTADCTHNIVIWEEKIDKRSTEYKTLSKDKNVEFKEFKTAEDPNSKLVFDVLDTAMRGGKDKALEMCGKIELIEDPYRFLGLMTTMAIKKLQYNNPKAPKVLKILAKTDMDMKTTGIEPWTAIKVALVEISVL